MALFNDGEEIEYAFRTKLGLVGALAFARITDSTLTLENVLFYPVGSERLDLGVRSVLGMARTVEQLAALEGFREIIVIGKRLTGATPGRPLYLRRRIR